MIDTVEDGYKDLKRPGLEREITTTSSISIIERKLPASIKREWAKLVSTDNSTVDKTDKFPSLLSFLLTQKRAIEYDTIELRLTQLQEGSCLIAAHVTWDTCSMTTGLKDHTYLMISWEYS